MFFSSTTISSQNRFRFRKNARPRNWEIEITEGNIDMDIEYGAKVTDKNGRRLGEVGHIIMDSWSGEPRKFVVRLDDDVSAVYFKPEHVAAVKGQEVSLNLSFEEMDKT